MKAAVLVTGTGAVPDDWQPIWQMLDNLGDVYTFMVPPGIELPLKAPQTPIADHPSELAAVKQALVWGNRSPVLLLSLDIACPSAELARYLDYVKAGYDAVIPMCHSDAPQPLFAVYTPVCIGPVNAAILSGRSLISDVLPELSVRYVDPHEVEKFGDPELLLQRT